MLQHNWQQLANKLNTIGLLVDTCCIWKKGPGLLTELRLDKQRLHYCEFCNNAKRKYGEDFCVRHDTETIASYVQSTPTTPKLFCCPAGAEEYVIPVVISNKILGAILIGPFRGKSTCTNLPLWRPQLGPALTKIIKEIIYPVLEELYLAHPALTANDDRINNVIEYIDNNFHQNITLKMAANRVFLSESRLSHLFKERCQEDFSTYLAKVRVKEAEALLRDTLLSIDEIANRCGLNNRCHFSCIFKKYNGLAPGQYRKKAKEATLLYKEKISNIEL
jgi:two-component system response regulator YesN